ncbi:retrovirus-related pol polyprotein from transposon TNT 1-94 [Tanacetum coccineum]
MEMEPNIENMMICEYLEYEAAKGRRLWDDVRSRRSPTHYETARVILFTILILITYLLYLGRLEEEMICGDAFDIWEITVKDVERIRKLFNVPDEIDEIVQPLIPDAIHTTPPNDDYVAPATKSMLDEVLEELRDDILNVTMVDEEADFNPTKDLEELERLLAMRPQSNFTKIQVHSVIINTEPFIRTQLMSPVYGVFKTSKPCKVDRDIISPRRYAFYSSFSYPVAYLHPKGSMTTIDRTLDPKEGIDTRLPSKYGWIKLDTQTKTSLRGRGTTARRHNLKSLCLIIMWCVAERKEKENKNKVKDIRAEKIARNANLLALVAATQQYPEKHYQAPKPYKTYEPSSNQTPSTSSHAPTRNKGKEIAKPITPPSESASKEAKTTGQLGNQRIATVVGAKETVGNQVVQQSGIQCFNCKECGHFAKEYRKPKRAKDYAYHKEKMMLCKQEEKGVPLKVLTIDSEHIFDAEPLEQVQSNDDYNVFAIERQHSEQLETIHDTYVVETVDSNVIPNSSDMCDNVEQAD